MLRRTEVEGYSRPIVFPLSLACTRFNSKAVCDWGVKHSRKYSSVSCGGITAVTFLEFKNMIWRSCGVSIVKWCISAGVFVHWLNNVWSRFFGLIE